MRNQSSWTDHAWVNVAGQLLRPADARVQVFDRGFLYGDSLYEVARTYGGDRLLFLDEHVDRLQASAKLCHMTIAQSRDELRAESYRTLEAFRKRPGAVPGEEAYCRLIVSRGTGRIGFGLGCLESPSLLTVIVQKLDAPTQAQWEEGTKLQISRRQRNPRLALDPAMKSGNYLNSLLAYLEAAEDGHDDALLCDADGFLTEGTTFNLFYVRDGIVATPPLDVGILDGITRRYLIGVAREAGIPVREVRFTPERLYEADEVFLSSTIKEAFPITRLDGRKVGDGKPGPVTRKLRELFVARVPGWLK